MAKKSSQPPPKTFEEGLRELDEILRQVEAGSMGLEESLGKYERGNFLIQHCRGVLTAAEKQIELISGSAEAGVTTSSFKIVENPESGELDDGVSDG